MAAEYLAFAPETRVAILIVPGARVTDIIQYSKTFAPIILLAKGTASDGDVTRTFPFVQTAIDRGDAGAYTQHIVTDRLAIHGNVAANPITLHQTLTFVDTFPSDGVPTIVDPYRDYGVKK